MVCLNVGGRIESKIVSGAAAHAGERAERQRHQSRGEESLNEFKPVSGL